MLKGKKTYIVVVGGVLAAIASYLQGMTDVAEVVNQILILLGVGALRIGVADK